MTVSRNEFLIDPAVVFLNHGSFGACPRPVFEAYQRWQLELERQPVEFLGRRIDGLLDEARGKLATYLNADANDIIFVPNATSGVNLVARSLAWSNWLQPGDEILATDHEYGACSFTWEHICKKTGAVYVQRPVTLPVTTHADMIEHFLAGITSRTRVIHISHITSPTALIFPVAEICRRARELGIVTVIDGAHAPGQVPVDLTVLDADFYTGNCHKWMCAPKGSGFLHVRREHQTIMESQIVSWGEHDDGSYIARQQKQGTRDYAAYLTVPTAIEYQQSHNWEAVQIACHELIKQARADLSALFNLPPILPDDPAWYRQMVTVPVPKCDLSILKIRLYDEFRVEIPVIDWNNKQYIRVSIQGYNTRADIDQLLSALHHIFAHQG